MEQLRHIGYYVQELKKSLPREYFQPVPHRLVWFFLYVSLAVTGIVLIGTQDLPLLSNVGLTVLIGISFSALGFVGHEILHGSVVRIKWLRNLLGGICFSPFNLGPRLWRKWHNVEHHGNTQHGHDDPDAMGTLEDYRERLGLRALFRLVPWMRSLVTFVSFAFWFSFHSVKMLLRFRDELSAAERRIMLLQYLLPLSAWIGLLVWLGPVKWVFAYVIPTAISNFTVMSYIATNHLLNPLTPVNDPLANSLSVTVPKWVDILHLNFSHHTEHHIFPAMNPKYAPRLKQKVKELWPDAYNEMPHWKALLTLWRTPRLYRDETSLVDPRRGVMFPVIGRGLDPDNIRPIAFTEDRL